MALDKVPAILITLMVIVAVSLVTFILAAELGDVASDTAGADSYAANATDKLEQGMYNTVEDADTWGDLISVGILVGIVFGFILLGIGGYAYARNKGYM